MQLESSFIQITGIGERTERRLWEHGVTDWRDRLGTSAIGPKRRDAVNGFAEEATDRFASGDITFFAERLPPRERWRLAGSFRERCVALDIETTGLSPVRHVITTVSVHGRGGTETLVRGDDLTRARLIEVLADIDFLVTYNGACFDIPFLEEEFDLAIDVPHLDLRYPCRRIGWTGGLSGAEMHVDIERELPDIDGREAVRLWQRHEAGDDGALDRLIRYNREDTRVLIPIMNAVTTELDRQIFAPFVQ